LRPEYSADICIIFLISPGAASSSVASSGEPSSGIRPGLSVPSPAPATPAQDDAAARAQPEAAVGVGDRFNATEVMSGDPCAGRRLAEAIPTNRSRHNAPNVRGMTSQWVSSRLVRPGHELAPN